MRAFLALALATTAAVAGGCTSSGIGRHCQASGDPNAPVTGTQISSPALECVSRMCIIQKPKGGETKPRSTCTATCNTDDDCADANTGKAADGLCPSRFVCAVAAVAGPFKCKKVCICRDDLECGVNGDQDGGVVTPNSCDPTAPIPSCS